MPPTGPPTAAAPGAIPRLAFSVECVERVAYAAVPTLRFGVRIDSAGGQPIRSILLDTQIQIAARRRAYDAGAREALYELFGPPETWGTTLRTLLWTRVTSVVPPFTGSTVADVPVTCTYDLEVAASRYFDALEDGEVPLELLFSGAVFYAAEDGRLQTVRIPWEHDADCRMPVRVWKETMEHHFPGATWVRLQRDSFERLRAFKSRRALATWEDALDALLEDGGRA